MAKNTNTTRTTENRALSTRKDETFTNIQPRMGAKVDRSDEAPWVGETCLLDHTFEPDMSAEAPTDMQSRLRIEAGYEPVKREEEKIPDAWEEFLDSTACIVYGYYGTPEEGEHSVRHVEVDSPNMYERRPFFYRGDVEKGREPAVTFCVEDVKTHIRWDVRVKMSEFKTFVQNVANENGGLGAGMTPRAFLTEIKRKKFRCWTLIDPEKLLQYQNRTFFSGSKYTQVYNAIQRKLEEAEKENT